MPCVHWFYVSMKFENNTWMATAPVALALYIFREHFDPVTCLLCHTIKILKKESDRGRDKR